MVSLQVYGTLSDTNSSYPVQKCYLELWALSHASEKYSFSICSQSSIYVVRKVFCEDALKCRTDTYWISLLSMLLGEPYSATLQMFRYWHLYLNVQKEKTQALWYEKQVDGITHFWFHYTRQLDPSVHNRV